MKPLILMAIVLIPSISYANCYSIKDTDEKNYCFAETKRKDTYCYSIKDSDLKNLCFAEIKQQKTYCYRIKSQDTKNKCLAIIR